MRQCCCAIFTALHCYCISSGAMYWFLIELMKHGENTKIAKKNGKGENVFHCEIFCLACLIAVI